jgi:hypothetical protein
MYGWLLRAHSDWRWVVILAGLTAVVSAIWQLAHAESWESMATRHRFFQIALDIQVLLGATLYLGFSPLTTIARAEGPQLPADSQVFFLTAVHPFLMLAAFVAVHLASTRAAPGRSDAARLRRALLFDAIALLLVLTGVPWARPWLRT